MFLLIAALMLLVGLLESILARWKVPDTLQQEADMQAEIAELKRQAAVLSTPDTFAQSAKAERKAIALCRQLERLQQERSLAKSHWLLALPRTARMAVLAFALFASTTALVQPAYLPPRAAWPLSRWLSFTSGKMVEDNPVGLLPWALVCKRAAAAVMPGRPG